jgi:hypothetical protein
MVVADREPISTAAERESKGRGGTRSIVAVEAEPRTVGFSSMAHGTVGGNTVDMGARVWNWSAVPKGVFGECQVVHGERVLRYGETNG